jgi:hypothetical protein
MLGPDSGISSVLPIERRTEQRKPVEVKSYLQLRGRAPAACDTINISLSGALVKPRGRLVRIGERVTLVVAFKHGKVVRTYYRKAIVVHVSSAGVGLRTYRHRRPAPDSGSGSISRSGAR